MQDERPRSCPECSSEQVLRIIYGLIDYDDFVTMSEHEPIDLGGCVITDESPAWRCGVCDASWGLIESEWLDPPEVPDPPD